jgi:HAD superfamily hydrolase (TIGR01509 family)
MLNALIFDIDGTLADTETVHRLAFNAAFKQSGLDWEWGEELYTKLLLVAGGKERIAHYWKQVDPKRAGDSLAKQTIDRIHAIKTGEYERRVAGGQLALRPGMLRLIHEALLSTPLGRDWRNYFVAVCDASTPGRKKPAPDIYLSALAALNLPAAECLAFEDSENGLRAATAAGIPTLITPTAYTALHDFEGALVVVPHLGDPATPMAQRLAGTDQRWVDLAALRRWHEGILFEAS